MYWGQYWKTLEDEWNRKGVITGRIPEGVVFVLFLFLFCFCFCLSRCRRRRRRLHSCDGDGSGGGGDWLVSQPAWRSTMEFESR